MFAVRAQHFAELLEITQEFGRLGVWEREIPSGAGRWDSHVFGFWGIPPDAGTPDPLQAAARVHPDDRSNVYLDSTYSAGRYAARYRVVRPDGSLRRIHSQWEVKNSALGVPARTVGIMVDDTEVYELAHAHDHTAAQLKLATGLADIVIWRPDLKTDRAQYNDHGFKVLGIAHRPDGLSLAEASSKAHPTMRNSSLILQRMRWPPACRSMWKFVTAAATACGATCWCAASSSATPRAR